MLDLIISVLAGLTLALGTLWGGYCRMFGCGVFRFETDAVSYLVFLIVSTLMYILLQAEIITYTQAIIVIFGSLLAFFVPQVVISKMNSNDSVEDERYTKLYDRYER